MHHSKILIFLLSASMALTSISPAFAYDKKASAKPKTGYSVLKSYGLASGVIYTEGASESDYNAGSTYDLDETGRIHLSIDSNQIYADGIAPDGLYYDENGNQVNSLEYIHNKYKEAFEGTSDRGDIYFDNLTHATLFMYWYMMHYGSAQNTDLHYGIHDGDIISFKKSEFNRIPTWTTDAWNAAVAEDAAKIDQSMKFKDQLLEACRLTHSRFTYNISYIDTDLSKALADGQGVCFHYSRYLYCLLNQIGIHADFVIGSLDYENDANKIHVWNTATDPETGEICYMDPTNMGECELLINRNFTILSRYSQAGVEGTLWKK